MHGPINVRSPNNTSKWQMEFNSAFKGLITTDNNTSAEINIRTALANRSYFGLVNILKAKNINRKYKVIIYETLNKTSADVWNGNLGSE
jgi:hypothetical protein